MSTESSVPAPRRWNDGFNPNAVGLQVRSIGRVQLPLGDAFRLEMLDAADPSDDVVHVQYYISTGMGGWALWVSCPSSELADREAVLRATQPLSEVR
jgi:hypothetical protein